MRLRVKTLTRRTFGLDVPPSASIDELKARLTQETGIPLAGQKLVYKGEVLHSGCVQDHCISEDEFLVVIVVRPAAHADAATTEQDVPGQAPQGGQGLEAPSKRPHAVIVSDLPPPRATDLSAAASVPVQLSELMHALASFSSAPNGAAGRLPPQLSPLSAPAGMRQEEEGQADEDEENAEDDHDQGDEEDEEDDDEEEEGVDGEEEDEDDEDPHDLQWDNAEALQQLIDMGFPENRARKALQINRGHAQLGMEWLLEHEGDEDIDEPLSAEDLRILLSEARQVGRQPSDEAAVQRLMEMGFSEDDIVEALEHCEHNFEAATAWLLGERGDVGMEDDGMEVCVCVCVRVRRRHAGVCVQVCVCRCVCVWDDGMEVCVCVCCVCMYVYECV